MSNRRTFKLGEFVHFYDSYTKHSDEAKRRTGKVTTLLNQYYGVTPINSNKELFFQPEELTRPDKPEAVQQSLIAEASTWSKGMRPSSPDALSPTDQGKEACRENTETHQLA